jgi:hypothetical protein
MKKTTTKFIQKTMLMGAAFLLLSGSSNAQAFYEGFDDLTALPGLGWVTANHSEPIGTVTDWLQGWDPGANNSNQFDAYSGAASSWACATFNMGAGTATLSAWMLTPERTISNDDTISFYTRATMVGTTVYPDRLQVLMSQVSGANFGTSSTDVGDFTTLLLDINSGYTTTDYPLVWTQYALPVSGLSSPVTGRFAFRYFVENGGPSGANSFIIGIDDVNYAPFSVGVPEINHVQSFTAYPNPTTEQVKFELATPLVSNATVHIINSIGQVVGNGSMDYGTKSQILNVSNFANGMYSVVVTDHENNVFRSSFVKN